MQYDVQSADQYIAALPEERRQIIAALRKIILTNLPGGFEEQISSGMLSYVIPLSRYPSGYHVKKDEPLPFLAIASQKKHIALYHMGLYGDQGLAEWFAGEYAKRVPAKLDMGKSCIRFKHPGRIPYDLIGELCTKMTAEQYICFYEQTVKRTKT